MAEKFSAEDFEKAIELAGLGAVAGHPYGYDEIAFEALHLAAALSHEPDEAMVGSIVDQCMKTTDGMWADVVEEAITAYRKALLAR